LQLNWPHLAGAVHGSVPVLRLSERFDGFIVVADRLEDLTGTLKSLDSN
jgi:hypothetical protein